MKLSQAADAASDMELAGSSLMGNDQHWELLPTQACLSLRVGSFVSGFQAFPAFPAVSLKNLSKYSYIFSSGLEKTVQLVKIPD